MSCSGCSSFLELDQFLNVVPHQLVDRFVNRFVVFSWTSPWRRVNRSRISPAQDRMRDWTKVFTKDPPTVSEKRDITNTFRGENGMRQSTVTIASLIQCFKHWPRRRVHKNTSMDRQMCLRLHQTVHAQINSCSPEGIKRVGCTFNNDMRIFKLQWCLNQQAARVYNVSLSVASSSI